MNVMDIFNSGMTNATASIGPYSGPGGIFIFLVLMGVCVGILAILFYVTGNIEKYRRFKKTFTYLYKLFSYAAYGLLTVAIVGLPLLGVYQLSQMVGDNPSSAIEIAKNIGIVVGIFAGLALVGYATKNRVWKRLFKYHAEEKHQQEIEKPVGETNV